MPRLEHQTKNTKRPFVQVDIEEKDVPMYRSYGKARRFHPRFEKFLETILKGVIIYFFLLIAFIAFIAIYTMMAFSNLMAFTISAIVGISAFLILSRAPRKRYTFVKKLKKFCHKNNYKLTFKRNFFASLLWDKTDGVDFTVQTRNKTYFVKFATATKRNSDMIFLSKDEMLYRKLRLNNKFTIAFDLKPRVTRLPIRFPEEAFFEGAVAVILLNPVPRDISIKERDGSTVATGDSEDRFGYLIHSGSGFLASVERNEKSYEYGFLD